MALTGTLANRAGSRRSERRALALACAGFALTALILTRAPLPGAIFEPRFAAWMSLAVVLGFVCRAVRRKLVLRHISWHKCSSFEAVFQGAILFHPQMPYPAVEREFVAAHAGVTPERLSPWFGIRVTSALTIPLLLAGGTLVLARHSGLALAICCAALVWTVVRTRRTVEPDAARFIYAQLAGSAGAILEGVMLAAAAKVAYPGLETWQAFLLYSVLLTVFELSPAPFALGFLEAAALGLAMLVSPGDLAGLWMAPAYRLWRGLPMALLTLFYLPRYKMRIRDLYDPRLARILSAIRKRPAAEGSRDSGILLSVVLPAYNEAGRLPRYLPGVIEYCSTLRGPAEVLVVDDGSTDGTAAYVELMQRSSSILRLIRLGRNQGKGAAVRGGVAEAKGRYVLFADADGATPIEEAGKLLEAAERGAEVVIGSRKAAGKDVRRDRSFFREFVGTVFYRVTNLLAVPNVSDTQCGFKLFHRQAADRIFRSLTETGWAFDVQALFLAQKIGCTIEEVPVNWTAVEGSKVRSMDALRMLMALLRIRRRNAGLTREIES